MDEHAKCVKITIRVEWADGTVNEMEAVEPEKVSFASHFTHGRPLWAEPAEQSVHITPGAGRDMQVRSYTV